MSRQHAVLQAVKVLAVDGWHEFSCCKTGEHMRRKVVLANSVAKLEVLVEHCRECKGNGLRGCQNATETGLNGTGWAPYLEVYVRGRWRKWNIR
jgi:hypothetical protein